MKKLIITWEYPPQVGGIATYVHQFTSELDSNEVVVLAPHFLGDKNFDKSEKIKVIRKNPLFWRLFWPRWLRLFFQVWWIVKKEKIEIIYLHHVLPVGYVARLIKKIVKVPYLVFSHGTDVEYASRSVWKKKMLCWVGDGAEAIVFNSESLQRRFLKIMPEFLEKTIVLYPCPSERFFIAPPKEEIETLRSQYALDGKKVMLTIARMDEGKGYTHLIRMLPRIAEQVPNLVWLVIGDGPKKEFLVKEVQNNSLQSITRFIGSLPHEELNKFYNLADLFVLLTHPDEGREEGLGMVFLEAAAAGVPVVAGKSGGVEEAVINAHTGLVVDIYHGDKVVSDSIVEMLKNEDFAKQLAIQAKQRIQTDFKWQNQIQIIKKWL